MQRKPASPLETTLLLLTLAVLWAGFLGFGQFISSQGFYTVSWKWVLGSLLIVVALLLVSFFVLFALIAPASKAWKGYESVKEWLNRKPIFILVLPFLVLILSFLIYEISRIRGLLGLNLFPLMLVWLILLPMGLFLITILTKPKKTSIRKPVAQQKKATETSRRQFDQVLSPLGRWNWLWMSLIFGLYLVSFFTAWNLYSIPLYLALLIFLPLAFLISLGLRGLFPQKTWGYAFIASIVFLAVGASLAGFFMQVSNNPFSQSWSEGTWIFNGSLIFAKTIYGKQLNPPILYANRAILQSVPFLLYKTAPIWLHRLWQAVLWAVLPITFGLLFSKRLGLSGISRAVFIGWAFLFLQQGPVYYFLFIAPILILLTGKVPRFWIATLLVVAASLWIGIDRVNWFPLPGCLMALLYLFENRYSGKFWRYWWKPLVWILGGTLVAISARFGLWSISGYPGSYFLTSVTSNLLTYRLLPNSTNPFGIFALISLAVLPISAALLASIFSSNHNMHWSRHWMLLIILIIFALGDMLVSLKIGGGNNLHNFDAFQLLLLVGFSMFFFGKVKFDKNEKTELPRLPVWLLGLIALIPVIVSFTPTNLPTYSKSDAQSAVDKINQEIASLPPDAKPVLFINQTQLLTTGQVKNVLPVPAYEMDLMMEMAMANNPTYLNELYGNLEDQRYSLIIAPELNLFQKGPEWAFGEENDAWNNRISDPILRYYHPVYVQKDFNVEILMPNTPAGK